MSNYWDLACRTCNVKSGAFHWNHGERQLSDLLMVSALDEIAAFGAKMRNTALDVQIQSGAERTDWGALVEFAAIHKDHDVRPRSEYGEYDDECAIRYDCPHCKATMRCSRPIGHTGDHDRTRRP